MKDDDYDPADYIFDPQQGVDCEELIALQPGGPLLFISAYGEDSRLVRLRTVVEDVMEALLNRWPTTVTRLHDHKGLLTIVIACDGLEINPHVVRAFRNAWERADGAPSVAFLYRDAEAVGSTPFESLLRLEATKSTMKPIGA